MDSIGGRRWFAFSVGLLVAVLAGAIVLVAEQGSQKPRGGQSSATPAAQTPPPPSAYVGDDGTCLTCHDTPGSKGTTHARAFRT